MRLGRAFESVQEEEAPSRVRHIVVIQVDRVAIRRSQSLQAHRRLPVATEELRPECLGVRSFQPPRWSKIIGVLIPHVSVPGAASRGAWSQATHWQQQEMEVQIFGVKKSADTRKALRFFAER